MGPCTWSAKNYVTFEHERTRPVRDLLAALPSRAVRYAVDLGCGPGNSTEALAAHFPDAAVVGIDSSADMVAAARERLPKLSFDLESIDDWLGRNEARTWDVILSNAVLHWLPDHATLLRALLARLAPGGVLAVQMPDNLDQPSHVLMREIAAQDPWAAQLASVGGRTRLECASWYHDLLCSAGCRPEVWRTTYYHRLAGSAAIVEWFKGSGLRPFMDALDEAQCAEYLRRYETAVMGAYPTLGDGGVLLPFPRLFIVAFR